VRQHLVSARVGSEWRVLPRGTRPLVRGTPKLGAHYQKP
jgi:hypothetical protein